MNKKDKEWIKYNSQRYDYQPSSKQQQRMDEKWLDFIEKQDQRHSDHITRLITKQNEQPSVSDVINRLLEIENKQKEHESRFVTFQNILLTYDMSFGEQKKQLTELNDRLKEIEEKLDNSANIYANLKSYRTAAFVLGNGLCFILGIALWQEHNRLFDNQIWFPVLSIFIGINLALAFGSSIIVKIKGGKKK